MAVFFLIVIALMIIVGTFLIYSVEDTYYKTFSNDVENWNNNLEKAGVLSEKIIANDVYVEEVYKTLKLYYQIDETSRKGYLLDSTGALIYPKNTNIMSDDTPDITQSIIIAMNGKESIQTAENCYEFAKPITSNGNIKYIFYMEQDRSTIDEVITSLKQTIIYTVFAALAIAIFITYLLSRAITVPIYKLQSRAEKMAEGDFTPITELKSGDEISQLADRFNYMAKKLETTLNEISKEKNKVEAILQNMNDGVIAFDVSGNVLLANAHATRLMKLTSNISNFNEIFKDIDFEMLVNSPRSHNDFDFNSDDRYLKVFFAKLKNKSGKNEGIIGVIQDVTKQEKLEEMRKDFVANVSHELKTPITSIRGYSETLLENEVDKETNERFLTVINSEAERMARIVSELLQLSKMDVKETQVEKVDFDIVLMIKEVISKVSIQLEQKGQNVIFDNIEEIFVNADRSSIEQVIFNILTNSIRYTKDGGTINVFVEKSDESIVVKVKDNGIGIPKKDLPRIFERFYRVDKARTREMGGTGLGLAISKKMIEINGGTISIDSEYGEWTEVTIKLVPSKILSVQI
jgi:two-component system sensor histidine kinase VicK